MKKSLIGLIVSAICLVAFFVPSFASAELVGYWKFDELVAGQTAKDNSASGYHGTPFGAGGAQNLPQPSTTEKASTSFANLASLYFDGDDDFLDLPDGFADFSEGMTVTLWARPTSPNCWGRFFDFGNGAASDNIIIARNGCSDYFYYEAYRGASTLKTSVLNPPIELNEWHYYTVTMDPVTPGSSTSVVQVYVDGVLAGMDTTTGYVPVNILRTNNYIGRSNWNDPYYQGYIDELRIYNRALTPQEVEELSLGEEGPGVDSDAPVISNVAASSVTETDATVTWRTDEDASTFMMFGTTTSYGSTTTEADTSPRVIAHSVQLSGLSACTTYQYGVMSRDASSNSATSTGHSFKTAGCPQPVATPAPGPTAVSLVVHGCKDPKASNYSAFSSHRQDMCTYGQSAEGDSVSQPAVAAIQESVCAPRIRSYIRMGAQNDPEDVRKLEQFLNDKQGESLPVDGTYSQADADAVKRFQQKYSSEVLGAWGLAVPTGYVYRTTLMKINSFYCNAALSCPAFVEHNSVTENSNSAEVGRTKALLSELGFYSGTINTSFDASLRTALAGFQQEFSATMLKPWGLARGTGYKYKTTNKFLNMLVGCKTPAVDLDGKGTFDY